MLTIIAQSTGVSDTTIGDVTDHLSTGFDFISAFALTVVTFVIIISYVKIFRRR